MKKVFTFFLTLFVASSVWAYDFVVDGIYYDIDEELNSSVRVTYKVQKEESYKGSITIPSSVTYGGKTYNVTSIGDSAFYDCELLTSVTIPNSVTSIGNYAFYYCELLTSVTIPNSVTSIGNYAFYYCDALTSITIPSSVTSIGEYAFFSCHDALYNIKNGLMFLGNAQNPYLVLVDVVDGDKLSTAIIPEGTKLIASYAFCACHDLTSVTIPNSVTSIGDLAFLGCSLTSITIPNSVTSIGDEAFYKCSGLISVTIPESLDVSDADMYFTKEGISYHVLNGKEVEHCGMENEKSTGDLVIPSVVTAGNTFSVTGIGDEAFYKCSGLTSVTIPNSVTSIGDEAFYGCSGLTSVTIPNRVTSIGSDAFSSCFGLTSITIPESLDVSSAGISFTKDGIWYYVLNGKEVELGGIENEKSTGDLVIPQIVSAGNTFTVTSIGDLAFYKCTSLTSVTIPNSVTSIGYDAFHDCTGLTSLTIPNSVTSIGERAFSDCSGLKSVIIGENVTTIGEKAFSDCSALSRVTCYAVNPPDADASSFSNYNGYLTIPCDNFEAYDIHPVWGSFKHVDCISAESTELPKDEVVVEPEISEAVFSMPTNASANSYTLTIQNNGVTFCTLTFNSQGQLSNIDFSGNTLKASVEGYQFTVTGLSASTGYNYSFKAFDKNKSVLKEYTGSFTTKNADGTGGSSTTAIDDVELANAISIINNQILVNGEAPAFVITSLGQKVANQNLKAGIYFVVVEGQNVSISIQ